MSSSTSDSINKMKDMTKEAHVSEMRMADSTDNSMAKTKKNDGQPMLPNTGKAQTVTAGLGMFGLALAGLVGLLGLTSKREDQDSNHLNIRINSVILTMYNTIFIKGALDEKDNFAG